MIYSKNIGIVKFKRQAHMKTIFLLTFLSFITSDLYAQVPEKPENVSPLLIGESVKGIELTSINGEKIQLENLYKERPLVLIVYRGGWCPFCNIHLAQLQEIQDEILAAGYQIIGVSPDAAEGLKNSIEKQNLKYEVYSDADMSAAQALGIAYRAPERNLNLLESASNGQNPGYLPVPSVFVIDKKGDILFEYINPNYKVRITGELLLAALQSL